MRRGSRDAFGSADASKPIVTLRLMSPQFDHGSPIPVAYTADGSNFSPPLMWKDAPAATRSFALIFDDPDALVPDAERPHAHWILYNLPADLNMLEEDAAHHELPRAAEAGVNVWEHATYDGPMPLMGRHRYRFKLYALDTRMPARRLRRTELERAMRGHVLDSAVLVGTYERIA